MNPVYQETRPSSGLARFVECFWMKEGPLSSDVQTHRVLPDGCLDVLFEFDDHQNPTAHVIGTMTEPLTVTSEGIGKKYFGVRFNPGQIRRFVHVQASELTDVSVELETFWGQKKVRELTEKIVEASNTRERIYILEGALLNRLSLCNDGDRYVDAAVGRAQSDVGSVNVDRLVKFTGVSRQYLARRFKDYVGVSPKMFCRVLRFRKLISELNRGIRPSWSAIASELGYYDQAHLINDFREFSGLSPEKYAANEFPFFQYDQKEVL